MGAKARRKRKERAEEIGIPLPPGIQETAISKETAEELDFKEDLVLVQGQAGEGGDAVEVKVRAFQKYHLPPGTVCAKHRESYNYDRMFKNGRVQQFPDKGGVHQMFPNDVIIMTPPGDVLPTPLDRARAPKRSVEEQPVYLSALLKQKLKVRSAQVMLTLCVHKDLDKALGNQRAPWDGSDDEEAEEGGLEKLALINESLKKLFDSGFTEDEVCVPSSLPACYLCCKSADSTKTFFKCTTHTLIH